MVSGVLYLRRDANRRQPEDTALPQPGTEKYQEMVSAFYGGVAALDVEANDQAQLRLTRATLLVPEEPAAWANRGLLAIRVGGYVKAEQDLEQPASWRRGCAQWNGYSVYLRVVAAATTRRSCICGGPSSSRPEI